MYVEQQVCQNCYFRFRRNGFYQKIPRARKYRVTLPGKGYQRLYEPNHCLADGNGYVSEHRMLVYAKYGDTLPPCELCGKAINWKDCHIDHIDNDVKNNHPSNIRPLCRPCNTFRDYPPQHTIAGRSSLTYEGVTQTANEWSRDPRVLVCGAQILYRKKLGMSDAEALFSEKRTHNGKLPVKKPRPPASTRKNSINATIDGVTQTAKEWSRHPYCKVSDGTIRKRLKAGWLHIEAVFGR